MRTLVYLTGTRAEYGLMKETLRELHRKFDLRLIATGMHISHKFGYTIADIRKDGLKVSLVIKTYPDGKDGRSMADFIGNLVPKITSFLQKVKPDLVLVEGDRGEQLAMAIAASHMNVPIAHTSGGQITGSIDNSIRDAITKFAHVHLAATQRSAERIISLGEEPWRVKVVGAPINLSYKKFDVVASLNLKHKPELLVIQHPVTTQTREAGKQIQETLEAIKSVRLPTIMIYPNSDAGSDQIIRKITQASRLPYVTIYRNLDTDTFMNLLNTVKVIVGNSSAGIVEAPFFKLSAVNIGTRQKNREHGDNVINVDYNRREIVDAINLALTKDFRKNLNINPYWTGEKPERKIADTLLRIKINSKLLEKEPYYKK